MSERTLKQLVGALVVAVAVWLVVSLVSGGGGSIGASGEAAEFFEGIAVSSVDAARFTSVAGSTELRRLDGRWTANGFPADSGTVARFLEALADMRLGDLAATNPSNHARMGVSDDSATTFEIDLAGATRALLVGKQGPRFGTGYGRFPGEDQVFVIEGDLRAHAQRRLDDWRDKEVVSVDTSLVVRIEVERDGTDYALVRGDSLWLLEDGGQADQAQVRNILAELSSMQSSGFLIETDSLYALPQDGATRAYADSGEVLAEITIGSGEGERWARRAGSEIVHRVSTFRIGRIAPTREAIGPGS
jgi:hypothetical protein